MSRKVHAVPALLMLILLPFGLPCAVQAGETGRQPIRVSGRITDATGKPVSGARCLWDWSSPQHDIFTETLSDTDGRYELSEPPEVIRSPDLRADGTLWFLAEGHAVRWLRYDVLPPATTLRREMDIQLKTVRPFVYLVTDLNGRPRLGELIEPMHLISATMMIPPPRPVREALCGTTDETGQFPVRWLAADQGMLVRVMSERLGTIQQPLYTTRGNPPVVRLQFPPVGSVTGTIHTDHPELFAGARVTLSTSAIEPNSLRANGVAWTTIDDHGRFHVPAIAEGMLSVQKFDVPDRSEIGWGKLQVACQVIAGQEATANIPVTHLIPISGRVVGDGGRAPGGTGLVTLSYDGRNPEISIPFDEDGHFRGWTYPGDVRLRADLKSFDQIPVGSGSVVGHATMIIDPMAKSAESPLIRLPKVRKISGLALGKDDRPLIGAVFAASLGSTSSARLKTDEDGRFEFVVSETTPIASYMYRTSERTLVSFTHSTDPLVLRVR